MKPFTESDRYDYSDLNSESVVFDCGGYEGNFSRNIFEKYGCKIFIFEPIAEFAKNIRASVPSKFHVIQSGVGAYARTEVFGVQNDATGLFSKSQKSETVKIISLPDAINSWDKIGLLKLNIEGMEYECLEALISTGVILKVQNLQVQFHYNEKVPTLEDMHKKLSKTHEQTFFEPYCWEGWKLK